MGRDEEVKLDLDDEPELLLDSLNAWREKVVIGELPEILRLSRHVELKLLYLLTSQLDRELVSHNVTVADLQRRMDGVFQKGRKLLAASVKLREEKLDLEVRLQGRLEELQKAWEEVSDLQG